MVHSWNRLCRHAPKQEIARHCGQFNEGKKATDKRETRMKQGKGGVGKGLFGCASRCRYFEVIE